MNNKYYIALFIFFYGFTSHSQNIDMRKDKSFAISFDILYGLESNKYQDFGLATIKLERIIKKNEFISHGYSVGILFLSYDDGLFFPRIPIVNLQYTLMLGSGKNLFETGLGFYIPYLLNFNLGYRAYFGKRLLFRLSYTPYVFVFYESSIFKPVGNAFTASLGYRFGIGKPKEKRNKNVGRLSYIQLNWQPLFTNYKGVYGFYGTVNLEILIAKFEKATLFTSAGFGYATSKKYEVNFSYNSIPVSLNALYGKGKRFVEAGLRFTWMPIGGNNDGTFFTLQPEIGYRIHIGKRLFARLAYTPYWWLSNEEGRQYIERSFVNSATVGAGIRFH